MKILYAIQGTGNGHIARARDIIPELMQYGNVDILVSGTQADIDTGFPVTYQFHGCSFIFGKKGGVDIVATARIMKPLRLLRDIFRLRVQQYDIVISDFEPVAVWACKLRRKKVYALSHQCALLHPETARPANNKDILGKLVLKHYAACDYNFGFYMKPVGSDIFPAVIRAEVRNSTVSNAGHYTVYLPSYSNEKLIEVLSALSEVQWQVFSKHCKEPLQHKNVSIAPIQNQAFTESLAGCEGALMGAGFEGPCEALYMGKKLLVIPMSGQYEQHCNAAALAETGVRVLKELSVRHWLEIRDWVHHGTPVHIDFPLDTTKKAVQALMEHYRIRSADQLAYDRMPDTVK